MESGAGAGLSGLLRPGHLLADTAPTGLGDPGGAQVGHCVMVRPAVRSGGGYRRWQESTDTVSLLRLVT